MCTCPGAGDEAGQSGRCAPRDPVWRGCGHKDTSVPGWALRHGRARRVGSGGLVSFCLEMIRLLPPLQMSQKVSGLLEEAKQGLALVLALLEKRVA